MGAVSHYGWGWGGASDREVSPPPRALCPDSRTPLHRGFSPPPCVPTPTLNLAWSLRPAHGKRVTLGKMLSPAEEPVGGPPRCRCPDQTPSLT